ncbi:MAG: L-threonylcarbamoyladenylate synthase [bacterium]|nr:L-threonylcarbamoyladenylate synthase [bacterium]
MAFKLMKKLWFKRKSYGWGWTLGTWESWLVMFLYVAANVLALIAFDVRSHSGSDTLINFAPWFLILTAILYLVCWWKGEKPVWQWGRKRIDKILDVLAQRGIVVMPTDTTYGIVTLAFNEKGVTDIYRLRKRDVEKPFIILISGKEDLKEFGVMPTKAQEEILDRVWPGPVSVILRCPYAVLAYLHRGKHTLAFRVPAKRSLRDLLLHVGPLVAPSANPQGHPIARNIHEARAYFGHHVNFYQDGGTITASPSKLIDITDGTEKVLRP